MPANSSGSDAAGAPSLAWACVRLALVVAVAYPFVALGGSQLLHKPVWETTAVAAGVCWFSSTLALVLFHHFRQAGNVVAGTLIGTLVRLGVPLLSVWAVYSQGGKLADDEYFKLVLVFYLVTLAADTMLSLGLVRSAGAGKEGRPNG